MKTSLNYTNAMKCYRRNAMAILKSLPEGTFKISRAILYKFLDQEKELLRKWYGALQMTLLSESDLRVLLQSRKQHLNFKLLLTKGLQKNQITQLRQDLLELLHEQSIQYSGLWHNDGQQRYKVRLYSLPIATEYDKIFWNCLRSDQDLDIN